MWMVGVLGYISSAVIYAMFSIIIFGARNKSPLALWLLLSTILTVFASAVAAAQMKFGFNLQWSFIADAFKILCWGTLILSFNSEHKSLKSLLNDFYIRRYLVICSSLIIGAWVISYLLDYSYEYIFLLFTVLNLWTLVLLEQLYRSADAQLRWAMGPLVIGLASMSVFDFVMFAQAVMVNAIEFKFWYSRGIIALLAMPLLLISTRRFKSGAVRVFVSRQVVFYSSMLMMAGVYLLIMASAGYLLNYFGGEWGDLLSVGFLILSGIVLGVLLITESIRRRLKVFIAKNFFANKYEYREEWLDLINKIEMSNSDNYYQMATQIMMDKLNTNGGALIKRIGLEQFETKYNAGIELGDSFNDDLILISQFCQNQGWIVDINEYSKDPLSYPSLFIQPKVWQDNNLNYIVPIFIGKLFYGLFVLCNGKENNKLNWEDRDLLFAISKQLGNFVSLNEANYKLAESKQFDAFNRMSAFLVHDLKNIQAQLGLISNNAKKHRDNPEFIDDVFETVESATDRLSKVLTQLKNKQVIASKASTFDIETSIERVIRQRNVEMPAVSFIAECSVEVSLDEDKFSSVLNHLIQNAQEATKDDGWVKVVLSANDKYVQIDITDNGTGMSAEFIENRLFKPFDTTKGNAGMGIGVFEAKQYFESVSGSIGVESTLGEGTKMTVQLLKSAMMKQSN